MTSNVFSLASKTRLLPYRTILRSNSSRITFHESKSLGGQLNPGSAMVSFGGPGGSRGFSMLAGVGVASACVFTYLFATYKPMTLPESYMKMFGYDPKTNTDECPLLETPSVTEMSALVESLGLKKGQVYTGTVDLSKQGDGSSHFYGVVVKAGNIHEMSAASGQPVDKLLTRMASLLGMIGTWAGCMMAGGATILAEPGAIQLLDDLAREESKKLTEVIATGALTVGYDYVQISNPERKLAQGAILNSFLARTMYFHSLSGSVLHMQYISASGDIYWIWVGAGGKGFNSKWVNNPAAIHLDVGMWPDMAKAIEAFYGDAEMVNAFVEADPTQLKEVVTQLIASTQGKKCTLKDLLQRFQVSMGYPARVMGAMANNSMFGVKGENKDE